MGLAMPRYFFHLTGGRISIDREGTELPNMDNARREAILYAAETLREQPDLASTGELRVDVTEAGGELLLTVAITAREPVRPLRLIDGPDTRRPVGHVDARRRWEPGER